MSLSTHHLCKAETLHFLPRKGREKAIFHFCFGLSFRVDSTGGVLLGEKLFLGLVAGEEMMRRICGAWKWRGTFCGFAAAGRFGVLH